MSVVLSFSLQMYARFRVSLNRRYKIPEEDDRLHFIELNVAGDLEMFCTFSALDRPVESPRVQINVQEFEVKTHITNPSAEIRLLSGSLVGPILDENVDPVRSGVAAVNLRTGQTHETWQTSEESEEEERMEEEGDAPREAGPSRKGKEREIPKRRIIKDSSESGSGSETYGIGLPGPSRKGKEPMTLTEDIPLPDIEEGFSIPARVTPDVAPPPSIDSSESGDSALKGLKELAEEYHPPESFKQKYRTGIESISTESLPVVSKVPAVLDSQGSTYSSRIRQRAEDWVKTTNVGSESKRTPSQEMKSESKGSSVSFTHWIHEEETEHEVEQGGQGNILSSRHNVFTEEGQVDRQRTVERSASSVSVEEAGTRRKKVGDKSKSRKKRKIRPIRESSEEDFTFNPREYRDV